MTPKDWPSPTQSHQLAADLVANVPTAAGEIARTFLAPLIAYLQHRFPCVPPDLCETAAADAILATIRRENNYQPERLELGAYLRMAACGDLLNLWQKERRRGRHIPLESVAMPADHGNSPAEDADDLTFDDPRLAAEIASFAETERLALDLMRNGTRDTALFAGPLGLSHLSPQEQAASVKRLKDKVKKRLARAVGGSR